MPPAGPALRASPPRTSLHPPRTVSSGCAVASSRAAARTHHEDQLMPRYIVERTFPDGLTIPLNDAGNNLCRTVDGRNAELGVHWLHSYVSPDKKKTFCVYDGPSPEAVRQAASRNALPVDR